MAHGFTDNKETADLDAFIDNKLRGLTAQVTALQNKINSYWQKVYPVGSIFTTVSTTSPATLFGGTWERYGVGRTLVGVDGGQSEFNSVNKQGGAKSNNYTPRGSVNGSVGGHALTVNEMPAHNHVGKIQVADVVKPAYLQTLPGFAQTGGDFTVPVVDYTGEAGNPFSFKADGGNASHNHGFSGSFNGQAQAVSTLQPYITVYFWRRTA
ncbi:MAG: hypothetical protein IKT42_06340 [Clostridia bacterium]|nr:hypothetical protein [Clostridia bacterium]